MMYCFHAASAAGGLQELLFFSFFFLLCVLLLFMCFDLVLLAWLLLLMIRVCVQRWSTWCGESELPRVLPMLHQCATKHQWSYSVSSGTNRDALLHLHHSWPLRSRNEACNQRPLVTVDAAAHHHDPVCKLQIMQLWVQTPKEKTSQKKGTGYLSHNHWKLEIYLCFFDYCCNYYFFSSSIQLLLLLMSSSDLVLICGSLEDHPGNPRMVNPCDGKYSRLYCLHPQSPFSTLSFFLSFSAPLNLESPLFLRLPNSQLFLAFGCSSAVRVFFFWWFAQLGS